MSKEEKNVHNWTEFSDDIIINDVLMVVKSKKFKHLWKLIY